MEQDILTFTIHFFTALLIGIVIFIGFKLILKFKGGLIAKFYKYIIYGSIVIILFHLFESLELFGVYLFPRGSIFKVILEHFSLLVLYSTILIGTFVAYKDYETIRARKKSK
jgi:hypothetical protein